MTQSDREEYFAQLNSLYKETQKKGQDGLIMSPRMAYEILKLLVRDLSCSDDFLMFYNAQATGTKETRIVMSGGVKFIRDEEGWRVTYYYPEEERLVGEMVRKHTNPALAKMFKQAVRHRQKALRR